MNAKTSKELHRYGETRHDRGVGAVAFALGAETLATTGHDGTIRL